MIYFNNTQRIPCSIDKESSLNNYTPLSDAEPKTAIYIDSAGNGKIAFPQDLSLVSNINNFKFCYSEYFNNCYVNVNPKTMSCSYGSNGFDCAQDATMTNVKYLTPKNETDYNSWNPNQYRYLAGSSDVSNKGLFFSIPTSPIEPLGLSDLYIDIWYYVVLTGNVNYVNDGWHFLASTAIILYGSNNGHDNDSSTLNYVTAGPKLEIVKTYKIDNRYHNILHLRSYNGNSTDNSYTFNVNYQKFLSYVHNEYSYMLFYIPGICFTGRPWDSSNDTTIKVELKRQWITGGWK